MTRKNHTQSWLRSCLSALVVLALTLGQFGLSAPSNAHAMGHGEMCGHMQNGEMQGGADHSGSHADLLAKIDVQPETAKHCHDSADGHCASICVVAMTVNAQTVAYFELADSPIAHGNVERVDGWLSLLKRPPRT